MNQFASLLHCGCKTANSTKLWVYEVRRVQFNPVNSCQGNWKCDRRDTLEGPQPTMEVWGPRYGTTVLFEICLARGIV